MNMGGLRVPGPLGVGQTEEEQIQRTWQTFDEMELMLTRLGIPPLEKPRCTIPKVTANLLTDSQNREFSQIFAEISEWYGFVTSLYGRIQAKLVEIDSELADLEVQNRRKMLKAWKDAGGEKKDKPTVQDLSDHNMMHPRVRALKHEWQQYEQQRLILQPRKEQLYRDWKTVSRQVEVRGQELERNRIGNNMPGRYPTRGT